MKQKRMLKLTKQVLLVGAAYGIIQVLMQDLGVKTGAKQRDLVKHPALQVFLAFSASYFITQDVALAVVPTALYFYLREVHSKGITAPVCFDPI